MICFELAELGTAVIGPPFFSVSCRDFVPVVKCRKILSAGGIKLTALIDYSTNNFVSMKIEFTTEFSAESISFDYVSGGPVSGSTKTVISYGNFTAK